jgi:hypothetical protein
MLKTLKYKYIGSYIHVLQKSLANIKNKLDRILGHN